MEHSNSFSNSETSLQPFSIKLTATIYTDEHKQDLKLNLMWTSSESVDYAIHIIIME